MGKPAIHDTTVYKVFAKWADDASLWHAFVVRVAHLSAEKPLDLRVLHEKPARYATVATLWHTRRRCGDWFKHWDSAHCRNEVRQH